MQLIQTVTVGAGGAASIVFSSIPQDGTDLILLISARTSLAQTAPALLSITLNSQGSSRITLKALGATVTSTSTVAGRAIAINAGNSTANTFSNTSIYIPNYTSTTDKPASIDTAVIANDSTNILIGTDADSFPLSAAVTSITITENANNTIVQNSTASLYKITKGSGGATVS